MNPLSRITLSTTAAALLALGAFALPAVAQAQPSIHVQVGSAPPPPRFERVPPPRRGHVWSPGHWEMKRHRHVWVPGTWVRARPGQHYRAPAWQQRGDRWEYRAGRWDRDRDGVPDRHDRRPNNPNRY